MKFTRTHPVDRINERMAREKREARARWLMPALRWVGGYAILIGLMLVVTFLPVIAKRFGFESPALTALYERPAMRWLRFVPFAIPALYFAWQNIRARNQLRNGAFVVCDAGDPTPRRKAPKA